MSESLLAYLETVCHRNLLCSLELIFNSFLSVWSLDVINKGQRSK